MAMGEQCDLFTRASPPPVVVSIQDIVRQYQRDCLNSVFKSWEDCRASLVVMATGTGKTVTLLAIVDEWLRRHGGKVLIIAHRRDLIYQLCDEATKKLGFTPGMEMGDIRAEGAPRLLVASKDSMSEDRMARLDFAGFKPGLIVCDEAHHFIGSNKSYNRIVQKWPSAKLLGVTATPDRADEVALGEVFDDVAYEYHILDAIKDGWLVPVRSERIYIDNRKVIKASAREFNELELDALMASEGLIHEMVKATVEHPEGQKKSIVFCTSVENAMKTAEVFNHYLNGSARVISQYTKHDERKELLASHRRGDFPYLCNVFVLTEGYDDPTVHNVIEMAPTRSRGRAVQKAGRATRPWPGILNDLSMSREQRVRAILNSPKPYCNLLYFVDPVSLGTQVTGEDILSGKSSDEVVKRAKEIAEKEGGGDVISRLTRAEMELAAIKRGKIRSQLVADVQIGKRIIKLDPFSVYDIVDTRPKERDDRWGFKPPSPGQLRSLRNYGIEDPSLSFHEARELLDQIFSESRPTIRQIACLSGKTKLQVAKLTFEQASAAMTMIVEENKWRNLTDAQEKKILSGDFPTVTRERQPKPSEEQRQWPRRGSTR